MKRVFTAIAVCCVLAVPARADMQFYTVSPCRLGPAIELSRGLNTPIDIVGNCGVPAGAGAVVLNLTVTDSDDATGAFIVVYDAGQPQPDTSNLNWQGVLAPGTAVANNAIVKLGPSGDLSVHAALDPSTTAHLYIDVAGYFR